MKNFQLMIQFMNLNRCEFAILFAAYYKKTSNIDDCDDDDNGFLDSKGW
jgi:hypothetical protein